MSKLRVASFSISIDGFGAGPGQSLEKPLGVGGMALHEWVFPTATIQRMFGNEIGTMGVDNDFAGTYTNIVPNKTIEYAFGDRAAQVEFANSPKGVSVRVTFDGETTHSVEQQQAGWQAILNNFARHVEASR